MIIRKANIYDSNDIAKVHMVAWNELYANKVSPAFMEHFDFEYRKKHWIRFVNDGKLCFVLEEKGGSIDGFIVPRLKRINSEQNAGEIVMHYVNYNPNYMQNISALLFSCAKLFVKNKANSMYTWINRESAYVDRYKELSGVETEAKIERMDSKDMIKIKIEWHDLNALLVKHEAVFDDMILEF